MKPSELELMLRAAEVALSKQVRENNTPGLIFNKGTEDEAKVSWKKALDTMTQMREDYFGKMGKGCLCYMCDKYKPNKTKLRFGYCKKYKNEVYMYDGCPQGVLR